MSDLLVWLLALIGSAGLGAAFIVGYLLFFPEKAEKVGGWIATSFTKVFRRGHRTAIALRVQGAINSARAELLKNAPAYLIDRRVKIRWTKSAEEATTLLREGEVLVVLKKSSHNEENIAHALMAFLPKAMLPRARRYVDPQRMRAADLIIARSLLGEPDQSGALSVLFEQHLDPARHESEDLRAKIAELDEVDLQGWLVRLLLSEYYHLGEQLHPGEPSDSCRIDAEEFARWLHRLATRSPGSTNESLSYRGRYLRVAVIFVAIPGRLETEGLRPYRRRARRYLWQDRFDAVYLMGRDANIPSVLALADGLETDVRVESCSRYMYSLRADFRKRTQIARDEAVIVCLRRRQSTGERPAEEVDDRADDVLPDQPYEPPLPSDEATT